LRRRAILGDRHGRIRPAEAKARDQQLTGRRFAAAKRSTKMSIKTFIKNIKSKIISENKVSEKDNGGSAEAQVAILTTRIRNLTEHMKANHKDQHSKRGLLLMVNRRKKLLAYIKKRNTADYEALIKKLGLRK
jgi:small subunit ribosomal protein S15